MLKIIGSMFLLLHLNISLRFRSHLPSEAREVGDGFILSRYKRDTYWKRGEGSF